MTENEIQRAVFDIIAGHFNVPIETISRDTVASDIADWNSVEHVALLMEMEDKLGFEFDIERIGDLGDVGEFVDECARLLALKR
ncbi:acyl carrier protein [Salmonella enterica subsp. enterica serovar Enteritidis]|nr:acyl carrier protein [Salmonella enterica subsp. enterica serovar Typhi]EBV3600055.1 acyl carrier protein [Salmonella enterica subsp. enterica serovar Virchow]EBW2353260.1 acyl carrier protein [Salmonella enterica subsp. enterica serovar Enteritidis]ECI7685810.1 acyl carrier protein [Salmonella enterica subsp. enterica serovar Paratyphi A]ECI7719512.1 acyl carrier protein [Salmonella enterica subsp. enterica]EFG2885696.1 acyl carrier protein [Escherichia coli]